MPATIAEMLVNPRLFLDTAVADGTCSVAFQEPEDAKHFYRRVRAMNHQRPETERCFLRRDDAIVRATWSPDALPQAWIITGEPQL